MARRQVKALPQKAFKILAGRALPECEVFDHGNWNTGEDDEDGFRFRTSLRVFNVGEVMNDNISSIIVYAGVWRFYEHVDFQGASIDRGVGQHNLPAEWNDRISSYEPISL